MRSATPSAAGGTPFWIVMAAVAAMAASVLAPAARASAQDDDPFGELVFGDSRRALGYEVYRTSFFELGYTYGWMPWITPDGAGQVQASGLVYDENKGPLINLIAYLIALMGVSDWQYTGSAGGYDYYLYDPARADRERAAIADRFSHVPFSMGAHVYSSAFGSQIDGFDLEVAYRDAIGDGLPAVVWGIGAHIGWLGSNLNWNGPAFQSVWGGGNLDLRITLFEYVGLWLRVGAWIGGPQGIAVPIELGPEVMIGNRFVIRALGSIEPVRYQVLSRFPDGLGFRLEAVIRL